MPWPSRNLVERGLILGSGPSLEIPLGSEAADEAPGAPDGQTLEELERAHIARTVKMTAGRIRGKGGAAERLGVHEATLRSRMKALGIVRPSTA